MGLTTDPNDPRLGHGIDEDRKGMNEVYLVLSPEELAKEFKRPVRQSYIHVGAPGPKFPLRDLTPEEAERYKDWDYAKYEEYPEGYWGSVTGRFWTQKRLDSVEKGCGCVTTMNRTLAETYARDPQFYGATFCVGCQTHLRVGEDGEFIWDDGTGQRVGA